MDYRRLAIAAALSVAAMPASAADIDYKGLYAKGATFEAFVDAATARKSQWQQSYQHAAVAP
jgi:hypothetical protein